MQEQISFGEWLRRQRRALDLSRQAFADQVGCAEVTLRRIEAGTLKPSKELAGILLEKLGIPETERPGWISFARGLSGFPTQPSLLSNKPKSNLPASLTTFIGREKEQLDVNKLIAKHRLVTLTGPGGVGKTRLSIKVGEQVLRNYADGVWVVELAAIFDPLLVPRTTAIAIGLPDAPQRPIIDMLSNYLREKQMLLILDNCEHLLDACAQLTDMLLKRCPSLKILATSREVLGILGEAVYSVPSLELPDMQRFVETFRDYESIRLFEERAQLAQLDFLLTIENASSVAKICKQLDGIPLAIELAAARISTFSTEQIAARLSECFSLLTMGNRTALPRHQTLQAAIDWSYDLLSPAEKSVFQRLSIFVNGWTLEAAQSICPDANIKVETVLDLLTQLINKSLVVAQEEFGRTRYRMLETIRQYANEKLLEAGESELLRDRHLEYFLNLAETAEPYLIWPKQIDWLNRLKIDHDNLRTALAWSLSNNVEAGLRMAGAVWWFWRVCGYVSEGCEWLSKLLALPGAMARTRLRAKALHGAAFLESIRYDNDRAQALYEESLSIYRELQDQAGIADALNGLGFVAERLRDWETSRKYFETGLKIACEVEYKHAIAVSLEGLGMIAEQQRDWTEARKFFERFLAIERELGNIIQIGHALRRLGGIAFAQGDISLARARFEESLSRFRELNFKQFIGIVLNNLASVARYQGDFERSSTLYADSLKLLQEKDIGFESNHAMVLLNLGYVAYRQGQRTRARELFQESLSLYQKLGDAEGTALCLVGVAGILASRRKPKTAVHLISAARTVFDTLDAKLSPSNQKEYEHNLAAARAQLGEAAFEAAFMAGHKMSLDEALDLALKTVEEIE